MAVTPGTREAARALATAWRVALWVQPAQTGTRPPAASATMRMTCSHSCSSRVGVSAVVPQATSQSMPLSTCQRARSYSGCSSMLPSARNGVTSAVPQPCKSISVESLHRAGKRLFVTEVPGETVLLSQFRMRHDFDSDPYEERGKGPSRVSGQRGMERRHPRFRFYEHGSDR